GGPGTAARERPGRGSGPGVRGTPVPAPARGARPGGAGNAGRRSGGGGLKGRWRRGGRSRGAGAGRRWRSGFPRRPDAPRRAAAGGRWAGRAVGQGRAERRGGRGEAVAFRVPAPAGRPPPGGGRGPLRGGPWAGGAGGEDARRGDRGEARTRRRDRRGRPRSGGVARDTGSDPGLRGAEPGSIASRSMDKPESQGPGGEGRPLGAGFPAASREQWRTLVAGVLKKSGIDPEGAGSEPEALLASATYDGIAISPLYTEEDG